MAYKDKPFVKLKSDLIAPSGFHYMPNGRLMSDADHIAKYGYAEKKIKEIIINTSDVGGAGGTRTLRVVSDLGAIFSVEIYEGNRSSYYNFVTKKWSANHYKLINAEVSSGSYSVNISFPPVSSLKTFTINVYSETVQNIRTKHITYTESRNIDGSLDTNSLSDEYSDIVTRTIYQDAPVKILISAIAPSKSAQSTATVNGTVSNTNRMILDQDATDSNVVAVGDLIVCTGIASSLGVLVTKINPDGDNIHEIEMSAADTVSDGVEVVFFPAFRGMTPNGYPSGINNTGRAVINADSGSYTSLPFSMTLTSTGSRAFTQVKTPTTEDLCVFKKITIGAAALPIIGESQSLVGARYRWPVDNVAGLANGMLLDPSRRDGGNNTTAAVISDYVTTRSLQKINTKNKYQTTVETYNETELFVSGIDTTGVSASVVDRNGRLTSQAGNITFSSQQVEDFSSDSNVVIYAQGPLQIKEATGMGVKVNSIKITPTQVSTTTSAASSASTTIAVTEATDIVVGQSVRSVGISSASANPIVVSKSEPTGACNIVVSSAQTLEDGATLFFDGASKEFLIEGVIIIDNVPIIDTEIFFNVERLFVAG